MASPPRRHPLIAGTIITSLGTLLSRGLGLLRDMSTAWLLGASRGGVADAFLVAFRVPNLFRQLFGEGALTASYLPVLTLQLEKDRHVARQLASVVVTLLAVVLIVLVACGELLIGAIGYFWGDVPGMSLLLGLTAVMLPYLLLICIAAQLTTMLYAAQHFTVPALAPTMLNIVWLIAALGVAPRFCEQATKAYVLAIGVLVSGVAQIVVQLPMLGRMGYRFHYHWPAAREGVRRVLRNMAPTVVGLSIVQMNVLMDSMIAWGLAASSQGPQTIAWLGNVPYPMKQGAAAVIYFGDRICEFPLGLVGTAVAVAIFPLLSKHAARGEMDRLGKDMTLGLKLVLYLGVPASAGLYLLAEPITRLLFQYGEFHGGDTLRAARMVAWYGSAVWAYCGLQVLVRGFYALEEYQVPVRVGAWMVGLNLSLNLSLIWPFAEAGLALSTAVCAGLQFVILAALFFHKACLDVRPLLLTIVRAVVATAIMAWLVVWVDDQLPEVDTMVHRLLQVGIPATAGAAVYCTVYRLLGGREFDMLLSGRSEE